MHTTTTTEEANPTAQIEKARKRLLFHLKGKKVEGAGDALLAQRLVHIGDALCKLGCKTHVCIAGYLYKILQHNNILTINWITTHFGEKVSGIVAALQYAEDENPLNMGSELSLMDRVEVAGTDAFVIKIVEWANFVRTLSPEKMDRFSRYQIKKVVAQWLERGGNILGATHQAVIDLQTTIETSKALS